MRIADLLAAGLAPSSVGSQTRTTNSPRPSFSASVMSNENGSDMPRCVPSSLPLTNTVASQSTAWKWRSDTLRTIQLVALRASVGVPCQGVLILAGANPAR